MSEQRDVILEKACELYLAEGMSGFSMRRLAREVGVSAPALYKHYDSREAVLVDVLGEGYRLLSSSLYGALGEPTAAGRFVAAGGAHLEFALRHRRYYELIYTHPRILGIESLPPEIEAQACAIHQFFIDRLRECMAEGIIREEDPERAAITLWGHAHGLISLYLSGVLTDDAGDPLGEEDFLLAYRESGIRLLSGMAPPEGVEALRNAVEEGPPARRSHSRDREPGAEPALAHD